MPPPLLAAALLDDARCVTVTVFPDSSIFLISLLMFSPVAYAALPLATPSQTTFVEFATGAADPLNGPKIKTVTKKSLFINSPSRDGSGSNRRSSPWCLAIGLRCEFSALEWTFVKNLQKTTSSLNEMDGVDCQSRLLGNSTDGMIS
jgi:hypothetical protein